MARFAAAVCIAVLSAWMATTLAARDELSSACSRRTLTTPMRSGPAPARLVPAFHLEPSRQVAAGRFPGRPESFGSGVGRMLDGTVTSAGFPGSTLQPK